MPLQEAIDNIKDYERMLHFNKVGLLARLQGKRKDKLAEEKLYLTRKNQLYQVATFDFDKIYDFMAEVLSRMTNEDFIILNYNMVTWNYPFINPSFPMPTIQSVKILTSEHEAKEINKVIEDFNYSINSLEAIKMYPHIGLIYSDKLLIFDFNKVNILTDLTSSYPKLKPYLEQLINVRLENPEISEDEAYNKVLETKLSQEVKRVRQMD